jgi:hypothetical protein
VIFFGRRMMKICLIKWDYEIASTIKAGAEIFADLCKFEDKILKKKPPEKPLFKKSKIFFAQIFVFLPEFNNFAILVYNLL